MNVPVALCIYAEEYGDYQSELKLYQRTTYNMSLLAALKEMLLTTLVAVQKKLRSIRITFQRGTDKYTCYMRKEKRLFYLLHYKGQLTILPDTLIIIIMSYCRYYIHWIFNYILRQKHLSLELRV
jgi:hypothetical protein